MRIILKVTTGIHEGKTFEFQGHDTFVVGRSKRAHFRLPSKDTYLSRLHFLVELNPPNCKLMDLGSRNGTFVNGKKVKVARLADGDEIRAGRETLRVSVESEASYSSVRLPRPSQSTVARGSSSPTPATLDAVIETATPARKAASATKSKSRAPASPCRVCGQPALRRKLTVPLCAACFEQVRGQEQLLAGYQLIRKLGGGGMGVVHLALRVADGKLLAIKTITPEIDPSEQEILRFLREAEILRKLDHPHIVAFHEVGEAGGQLYFAMDYVAGTDAARLLVDHGGPLPIGRAVGLMDQLLDALEYAHARGFVHRDIKPGNILIGNRSGREEVKLADFGLARTYQASVMSGLTVMGDEGGTYAFMPPEQVYNFREAKPASDLYSTAATLYTLLTDRHVHDLPRDVQQRLLMITEENPIPIRTRRPDLPKELAEVIHHALAKDPEKRFADARAMRDALARFLEAD